MVTNLKWVEWDGAFRSMSNSYEFYPHPSKIIYKHLNQWISVIMPGWLSLLSLICSILEVKIINLKNRVTDVMHKNRFISFITLFGH